MGVEVGGLLGLLVLVLNVWAIIKVMQSSAGVTSKVFWIVVVLIFPVVGFLVWFLMGPRG